MTICTCGIDWLPQSRKLLLPCALKHPRHCDCEGSAHTLSAASLPPHAALRDSTLGDCGIEKNANENVWPPIVAGITV